MSGSLHRESIVLEEIKPDCDWKQWHQDNFQKIKNNKFEDKQWIQPSCDHRTYRYLELNNGLKVLLIYDNKQERKSFEQNEEKIDIDNDNDNDNDNNNDNDKSSNNDTDLETDGNNYYDVALCVNRGYFSDFIGCEGIAHYCEHMIFMGNKKYSTENDWEDWLSLNGNGSTNASTYNKFTNYVFDITPKGKQLLFEALDRFANNFIAPLFNPDSSERELNAIENEFNFHKTDDGYKQWLVLKKHVLKMDNIPYYKFGSGNKQTLSNQDINDKLIKYWTQNYLPSNMSLVILSDVDLNELETFVVELFEQIMIPKDYKKNDDEEKKMMIDNIGNDENENKNENEKLNPFRMEPNLLEPIYGKLFRVNSVKEHYTLDIYWILNGNECIKYYDSSPTCFISELLGHEGKGSLYCFLNDKNYINSLECGYETNPEGINHDFELFEVNFDLTQKGYDNVYEIVDCLFKYLSMMKQSLLCIVNDNKMKNDGKNGDDIVSIKEYFIESKLLGEIAFNFSNNTNGWSLVDNLSIKMHQYPIYHLLSSDYIYWKYDPLLILNSLKELIPERCTMMLLSIDAINYKHKIKDDNIASINDRNKYIEPILETKYSIEDIPKCYLKQWSEYMDINRNNIDNKDNIFHLPIRNTFIPTNLNLLSDAIFNENKLYKHFLEIEKTEKCGPELLVYNECMKIYFKCDRTYFLPKSYITMVFEHDSIWNEDGKNICSLQILVDIFEQYFSSYSYLPTLAGLNFETHKTWRGLKLYIYGYSEKLYSYFKQILNEMATFKIDNELFETQKNALIRSLKNEIVDCEDHLPYIARKCIIFNSLTIDKELNAANNLTINDIENVRDLLFFKHENNIRIYGLFMGNIEANVVMDCSKYLIDTFNILENKENISNIPMYNKYKSLLAENRFLSQSDQRKMRLLFSKCNCQSIDIIPMNDKNEELNLLYLYKEVCISSDEDNDGALIVYQMDDKPVDDNNNSGIGIMCSLLRSLLSEPFYDSLRTKQQLGYEVDVSYETVANIPFLKFQVISSQYNPNYLTLQILKFINHTFYNQYIIDILQENNNEKIKDKIDSAIRSRKIECSTLSSRNNMYWAEIFTYNTLEFNAKISEVKSLKSFNYNLIKQIYENKLLLKNKPKCIILQIWKQQHFKQNNKNEKKDQDQDEDEEVNHIHPKEANIMTLDELKDHLCDDLKLNNIAINEIDDIISWQNNQNRLPSYL